MEVVATRIDVGDCVCDGCRDCAGNGFSAERENAGAFDLKGWLGWQSLFLGESQGSVSGIGSARVDLDGSFTASFSARSGKSRHEVLTVMVRMHRDKKMRQ